MYCSPKNQTSRKPTVFTTLKKKVQFNTHIVTRRHYTSNEEQNHMEIRVKLFPKFNILIKGIFLKI